MVKSEASLASGVRRSPAPVAYSVVLGWNVLLLAIWSVYVVVASRAGAEGWEDLVMLVGMMLGIGGFAISYLVGLVAVLVMRRRPRWRQLSTDTRGGILTGTVAAAIGFSPFAVLILWGTLSALFH